MALNIFRRNIMAAITSNSAVGMPFAPHTTAASRRPPALSFQQFIQRGKVRAMYRKYMRLTKRIPDKQNRREMREWIRSDFDRYRHETDSRRVEVLLAQASRQYKEMESGMFTML